MVLLEHLFYPGAMDGRRVLNESWPKGDEWTGHHVVPRGQRPVPVIARVQWDDGTTEDIDAWADQWTRTHVGLRVHVGRMPRLWLRVEDVRRQEE
jgi:hypothetical protein